jgi:tRNA U38,U39,U40 pseudouridine synthase TruA
MCARGHAHEPTVVIETPTGALRVSFQHRYTKLPLDLETDLRGLLGDDYDRLFKRAVSLKVKKEIAEDPAQLDAMVIALAEALGAKNFASFFEVEQSLTPTKTFTEAKWQFPVETRAALQLAGVRQIVAFAAK